jgi:hypothetical protein
MTPQRLHDLTDRELLVTIATEQQAIKSDIEAIKGGQSPNCIKHDSQIQELWQSVRGLWAVFVVVGGAALTYWSTDNGASWSLAA